jgi:hypothetical protein
VSWLVPHWYKPRWRQRLQSSLPKRLIPKSLKFKRWWSVSRWTTPVHWWLKDDYISDFVDQIFPPEATIDDSAKTPVGPAK